MTNATTPAFPVPAEPPRKVKWHLPAPAVGELLTCLHSWWAVLSQQATNLTPESLWAHQSLAAITPLIGKKGSFEVQTLVVVQGGQPEEQKLSLSRLEALTLLGLWIDLPPPTEPLPSLHAAFGELHQKLLN